jgi:hypothetical protein
MVKNWREKASHRSANIPILNDNAHSGIVREAGKPSGSLPTRAVVF